MNPVGDASGPTSLNALPVRWMVLALQCVALIGSYYCYDNPTAVENQVRVLLATVDCPRTWGALPRRAVSGRARVS